MGSCWLVLALPLACPHWEVCRMHQLGDTGLGQGWLKLHAHPLTGDGDPGGLNELSLAWLLQDLDEFLLGENLHLLPLASLSVCHSGVL